jgi:hypothetical protein
MRGIVVSIDLSASRRLGSQIFVDRNVVDISNETSQQGNRALTRHNVVLLPNMKRIQQKVKSGGRPLPRRNVPPTSAAESTQKRRQFS